MRMLVLLMILLFACGRPKEHEEQKPEPKPEQKPDTKPKPEPKPEPQKTYVDMHGMLGTKGNRIVDQHGEAIQLKGMSLFWSQWSGQWWTPRAVSETKTWGATVIRAAMGVEMGGYLANPEIETARVRTIVDAAIAEGIYVIIDWHAHGQHREQAVYFFREMAREYRDTPNVIFEIWNEPINESWSNVKGYAEAVIGAIRSEDAQQLVIVGSPSWSQRVDLAANDPVGYDDVAYAIHFYSATHRQGLRDTVQYALDSGVAIFATEWGTCDASGNGYIDLAETKVWLDFLAKNQIGWANWSLHDKNESASALAPDSTQDGPWRLTKSGEYVRSQLAK